MASIREARLRPVDPASSLAECTEYDPLVEHNVSSETADSAVQFSQPVNNQSSSRASHRPDSRSLSKLGYAILIFSAIFTVAYVLLANVDPICRFALSDFNATAVTFDLSELNTTSSLGQTAANNATAVPPASSVPNSVKFPPLHLSEFNNLIGGNFWPAGVKDNQERVAICLVGEARTFATDAGLRDAFVENVVKQIGAERVHVFVSTWNAHWRADESECQQFDANSYAYYKIGCPRQQHSFQDAEQLTQVFENLGDFVMAVQLGTIETRMFRRISARCNQIGGSFQSYNFMQYSRMQDCLHQIRVAESTGFTYSWVIKLRPDLAVPPNMFRPYDDMIAALDPQAFYGKMWHRKESFHDQFLAVHRHYSHDLFSKPYPDMQALCYPPAALRDHRFSPFVCPDYAMPECFLTLLLHSLKFPGGLRELPWDPLYLGAGR
jgi:hypothetical protein